MKNSLVLLALVSSSAFAMNHPNGMYYWKYTFEGKTFHFTAEKTKGWTETLQEGADACMAFFKADPKDDERYEILTGECVNPEQFNDYR